MRLTLAVLLLAATACAARRAAIAPTLPAGLELRDLGGSGFSPGARFRGRILVIDFWASWCVACRQGVPRLVRLSAAYPEDQVAVLGVDVGEDEATARRGAEHFGISYPIALDPDFRFADALGAGQLPLVVVVDRHGRIVHRARELDAETLLIVRELR